MRDWGCMAAAGHQRSDRGWLLVTVRFHWCRDQHRSGSGAVQRHVEPAAGNDLCRSLPTAVSAVRVCPLRNKRGYSARMRAPI